MFSFLNKDKSETLSVKDLDQKINEIQLIDIREPHEYASGHVPKAKNIPMGKLAQDAAKLLKTDQTYHIICQSGGRSARMTRLLKQAGFKVVDVTGGTGGYPGKLVR